MIAPGNVPVDGVIGKRYVLLCDGVTVGGLANVGWKTAEAFSTR